MAIVGHLHKLVWGGKLCQTETWSASFHLISEATGDLPIAGDITSALNAWMVSANSAVSPYANLEFIKCNELDPAPRVNLADPKTGLPRPASPPYTRYLSAGAVNEVLFSPGAVGTGSPSAALPQSTVAVSLTTGVTRGLAHTGRFYPPTGAATDETGRVGVAVAGLMAQAAANLIADLNSANGGLAHVVIYSGARGQQSSLQVTGVRVGRVVDTQQRRRKNLLEDYQLHDLSGF